MDDAIICREEVFQVEWDPNHETVLASTADDRRLMVWDLNRYLYYYTIIFKLTYKSLLKFTNQILNFVIHFTGLGMSNWKAKQKMVHQSSCFLMVVTRLKYPTSHGTKTNPGLYLVWPKTMLYRSGKWLKAFTMKMMTFEHFDLRYYVLENRHFTLVEL